MSSNYGGRSLYRAAGLIVFLFLAFTCGMPKTGAAARPPNHALRVDGDDSFMTIAMELRMRIHQARPNEVIPLLQDGVKKLEDKAIPECQTKELVAVNLIYLMHLYRAVDENSLSRSRLSPGPLAAQYRELRPMKERVIQLADFMVKHLADNQAAKFMHDGDDLLTERLKMFSEIYAAAADTVLRQVSSQVDREIRDGSARNERSMAARVRRYLTSARPSASNHERLFKDLGLTSEQTFLREVGDYMIKLLGVRRGDPSRFYRRTLLSATTIGSFGYATIMLPTPFREAVLIGLIAGSAGYFRRQHDAGVNRKMAVRFREFQSGRSLYRAVKNCDRVLRRW